MRLNRRTVLEWGAAALALAGIGGRRTTLAHGDEATPDGSPVAGGGLFGRRWHLVSIAGASGTEQPEAPPQHYWVVFWEDGSLIAQVDCNAGRGGFTLDGDALTIEPLATTRMACPEPSLGAAFGLALGQPQTVAVEGDTLTLTGADGTVLTFGSVLKGAVWTWMTTTHPGSDAVVTNAGRAATIQLFPTGQMFLTAPCNSGGGGFKLEGDSLAFTAIFTTMMACDALESENAFLQALNATTGYRYEGDDLVLTADDGSETRFSSDLAESTTATPAAG